MGSSTTTGREAGRLLAQRLGLKIIGMEADKAMVACPCCDSHDAGRVFSEGNYWCHSCQKALNAFDLCKVVLGDHEAAKRLMFDVGLFPEYIAGGNGKAQSHATTGNTSAASDDAAFLEVCRLKRMPPDACRQYGGEPYKGGIAIPMFGPDKNRCSFMHITPSNGKGKYAKSKPTGLFLPGQFPAAGESWFIVEGPKDATALFKLGHLTAGLPGNQMSEKFASLFQDVDATILTDGDKAGREGGRVTDKNLRPVARSVKVGAFPDGKDARDVIATEGPEGIARVIMNASEDEQAEPPRFVNVVTCPEFLGLDLKAHFLIRDILVAGQPCVAGGRSKTLKTSIIADAVVSLGSGASFLGKFPTQKVNVGFWSGESGAVVVRETALRIAKARGVDLAGCSIVWGFDLPKLSRADHLEALADVIEKRELGVVVVDPLYLSLLSPDAVGRSSDLFFMGTILQPLAELGQQTGCTIILLHHFRKNSQTDDVEPAGLEELAQSGVAEWARQWILLQRRSPYQADGHHELWMRAGGSAGHAGLWALDIQEGLLDPDTFSGRKWEVTVTPAADARAEARREKENRKAADLEKRDEQNRERLLTVLRTIPEGDTERALSRAAGLNPANFHKAITALLHEGRAVPCKVIKHKRPEDGFKPTGK
jgi:hypothetical protein